MNIKTKLIITATVGLVVILGVLVKTDIENKRAASERIIDICMGYEYFGKLDAENAIDGFNYAVKHIRFLNTDREKRAAREAKWVLSYIEIWQGAVGRAQESLAEADSDYARKYRQESLDDAQLKLAIEREKFGNKMRFILSAYK